MVSSRRWEASMSALCLLVLVGATGCSGDGTAGPGATTASVSPSGPVSTPASPAAPVSSPTTTTPAPTPTASAPASPAKVTQRRPGWALDRIDQRKLPLDQRFTTAGQGLGVTVYVVDGLFNVKNAELGGRASVGLDSGRPCGLEDGTNHGLFVAGLIAGRRTGVAKQARIVAVGSSGGCEGGSGETDAQSVARIVKALDWVGRNARKPAVVNLSLNIDQPAPKVAAAVKRLVEADLTVVASAGNDGEDACGHPPAGLPSVITVGASTENDRDAELNFGRCVDLYAPADGVTSVVDSSLSPDRVITSDGAATSWAAPLVSGAAALYLSAHPEASPAEVRAWLLDNATTGAIRGDRHGSPNRLLFTGGPI